MNLFSSLTVEWKAKTCGLVPLARTSGFKLSDIAKLSHTLRISNTNSHRLNKPDQNTGIYSTTLHPTHPKLTFHQLHQHASSRRLLTDPTKVRGDSKRYSHADYHHGQQCTAQNRAEWNRTDDLAHVPRLVETLRSGAFAVPFATRGRGSSVLPARVYAAMWRRRSDGYR